MNSRSRIVVGAVLALIVAFPTVGRADDKEKQAASGAVVHFGQPQPQTPDPAPVGIAVTHFLLPDDVTIRKGGTVTFVVNGGGHGIAIHRVSKNTTRDEIAEDLCQGGANDADRRGRAAVCNGTAKTLVNVNGTNVLVTGTQNLDYSITDGKDNLIIHTGFNLTAANSSPVVIIDNPRVDDTEHSARLLATSGRVVGDTSPSGARADGALLTGTTPPTPANPTTTPPTPANPTGNPGNRIQVQFLKEGRFLVICMNRAHSLNDHMFGFVSVVDDDDDK
jgi:hypothetical protein